MSQHDVLLRGLHRRLCTIITCDGNLAVVGLVNAIHQANIDINQVVYYDLESSIEDLPLFKALHGAAKRMVELGLNVNATLSNDDSLLHIASSKGWTENVARLISFEANVNHLNQHGQSSLYLAAYHGNCDVIDILLDNEADVNLACHDNQTPIHIAANKGYISISEKLLMNQAKVNQTTSFGITPLMEAVEGGHFEMVQLLRMYGAEIDLKNNQGLTAIDLADKKHFNKISTWLKATKHYSSLCIAVELRNYPATLRLLRTNRFDLFLETGTRPKAVLEIASRESLCGLPPNEAIRQLLLTAQQPWQPGMLSSYVIPWSSDWNQAALAFLSVLKHYHPKSSHRACCSNLVFMPTDIWYLILSFAGRNWFDATT